ncbi:MAG: hypothetical protein IOC82_09755 [Aestuariivirga sp.]|uniref:hypothetical protein n=1 Tax=Aestuariivirga sp. TaxID=2650926 RepID=UPI0025BBF6E8|nr:hypothetical protein [Aestuariivirga sp.]MCA3561296.1 hypothetical protein [Aestuariivirga sp.]
MSGELDPRLVGLLKASLSFIDALRDIGVEGEIAVKIDRDGARQLVNVVDVHERGRNGVNIAGLRFEWPKTDAVEAFAENDNDGDLPLVNDETPALK